MNAVGLFKTGRSAATDRFSEILDWLEVASAIQSSWVTTGIQRVPNLLRWTGLACRLPYPGAPKSANDCCFLFGFSLHLRVTGSAITLVVSRLQSSLRAYFALMLRPASWLALLSRTFTFEACANQVALNQRRI